jgi:prepilin-type N-terminal cleavage/methylation domain-containing protein
MKTSKINAFTLTEALVVVAVIAIFVVMAIPLDSYPSVQVKGHQLQAVMNVKQILFACKPCKR